MSIKFQLFLVVAIMFAASQSQPVNENGTSIQPFCKMDCGTYFEKASWPGSEWENLTWIQVVYDEQPVDNLATHFRLMPEHAALRTQSNQELKLLIGTRFPTKMTGQLEGITFNGMLRRIR